jgi:hypothetical protein
MSMAWSYHAALGLAMFSNYHAGRALCSPQCRLLLLLLLL